MGGIRQAIIYSSAARYTMKLMGLVSTMLISRLLTPEEIGTFAIASAIVMVMSEFRMLGAGGYLIREKVLNPDKVRSVLGLTLIISWSVGVLILAAAWPAGRFYDLPDLAWIFVILSGSFFLAPYISIPSSLYSRSMDFRVQFKIRFVSTLLGFFSTIGLILLGFSYFALAFGQSIMAVSQFLMFLRERPENMEMRPSFRGLKAVASFGVFNSLANLLRRATLTVPDMVIGKMGTTAQVGMFSRGLGFVTFVSQTLTMGVVAVALPYLSNTRRSGGDLAAAYTRASVMMGGLVVPVLGVASLMSLPAIRLFFGPQWDAAAPLAAWLAVWGMIRVVHNFANDVLMASERERVMLLKEVIAFAFLLTGIILAYPHGLESIARVFVLAGAFEWLLVTWLLWRVIGLSPVRFVCAWWGTALVTALCMLVTWALERLFPFDSPDYWKPIVVVALTMPWVWLVGLKLVGHPLFTEIVSLLRRRGL
ncbi:hypothetical protein BTO32_03020 [Marinobacter lutaoensis]|uniref:Polysaccharide biosynthesis protein n=1 Tax=Marinobacter lutaoensis TaxID=135739 RepID=A0A1V2DYD9_9GAMM|nr:oligosaccharide flippase family protein [Marinobacter lutaoensis]ONF45440.1 hypothetical protein BTO32_03020 [Marinobacter lutaoensis]